MSGSAAGLIGELLPRCRLPEPGAPAVCAFSGGADSTALLLLALAAGCAVSAVHVDHGLRPDSAAAADAASAIADGLGVGCTVVTVAVGDGPNLEARARAARYAALPAGALTGHTADDRAETLLINLLRGAGLDGLTALAPGATHPLLDLRRSETAELCRRAGVAVIDDPTNDDPRHLRNRLRHEVLPLLDEVAGRDVAALLARTATVLDDDAALLAELLADAAPAIDPSDARALAAAGRRGRRALRQWLTRDGSAPSQAVLARAWAVATGAAIACELGGGRRLERHAQRLRIVDQPPAARGAAGTTR